MQHKKAKPHHDKTNYFTIYHKDIVPLVLQNLDMTTLARMERVDKFFQRIIREGNSWSNMLVTHYPEQRYFAKQNDPLASKNKLQILDSRYSNLGNTDQFHTIARLISGNDFSKELLEMKGFTDKESFFQAVNTFMIGDSVLDLKIQLLVFRCKNQELLDFIYKEQLKYYFTENGTINVTKSRECVGFQALHYACICNQPIKIIQELIEKGADVNKKARVSEEYTPLSLAAFGGRNQIISLLLSFSTITIRSRNTHTEKTPLYHATHNGEVEAIKILLNDKRVHNKEDFDYAFTHAVFVGMEEIVNMFIKVSPSIVNTVDNCWCGTPLCCAVAADQSEMFNVLVKNGADVNLPGENGDRPLHIAAQKNKFMYISKLVSLGAEINLPGRDGSTPLMVAVKRYSVKCVHELLFYGASVGQINPEITHMTGSISKFIKTFKLARKMMEDSQSLQKTAYDLLNNYLSPKSILGNALSLKGGAARFFAGKINLQYCKEAKMLLSKIININDIDDSSRLIKQFSEEILDKIDNESQDDFYPIIASIHILGNNAGITHNNLLRNNL